MRISEKMGLVYTALFLTVSVAVITQNSGTLMAIFRGESGAVAVDDIFTVQAGRDQKLLVLRNDVRAQSVRPDQIHLIKAPDCGQINQLGGSFVYSGSASCSGHQTFTYCLDTGRTCDSASVALRLVKARKPIDSVMVGPITDLSGFAAQVGINSRDLEIANVHLGASSMAQKPVIPTEQSKLAEVAVATNPTFRRPEPMENLASVRGAFNMPDLPPTRSAQDMTGFRIEASAASTTLTDQSAPNPTGALRLPDLPDSGRAATLANFANPVPVKRRAGLDSRFMIPTVMPGIDASPFGTPCNPQISASAAPGALVWLKIQAPCHPNSRVELRHGKLIVTFKTDHIGNLATLVPVFEQNARFSIKIGASVARKLVVNVPDLAGMDRVGIQWRGAFPVTVQAVEFGTTLSAKRYLRADQPENIARILRKNTGFLLRLGDDSVENPAMAVVYSLPRGKSAKTGVIDFIVSATATNASCGRAQVIQSFRSKAGRLIGASGLLYKMPACGAKTQSIVLKHVVRDLVVAAK